MYALIKRVIAPAFTEALLADIGKSDYSLVIDESTDISTVKLLCVMIHYYSESQHKLVTTFYKLLEVEVANAESLTNLIIKTLHAD